MPGKLILVVLLVVAAILIATGLPHIQKAVCSTQKKQTVQIFVPDQHPNGVYQWLSKDCGKQGK